MSRSHETPPVVTNYSFAQCEELFSNIGSQTLNPLKNSPQKIGKTISVHGVPHDVISVFNEEQRRVIEQINILLIKYIDTAETNVKKHLEGQNLQDLKAYGPAIVEYAITLFAKKNPNLFPALRALFVTSGAGLFGLTATLTDAYHGTALNTSPGQAQNEYFQRKREGDKKSGVISDKFWTIDPQELTVSVCPGRASARQLFNAVEPVLREHRPQHGEHFESHSYEEVSAQITQLIDGLYKGLKQENDGKS